MVRFHKQHPSIDVYSYKLWFKLVPTLLNNILVNKYKARKTYEALQVHAYDEKGKPQKFNEHKGGAIDDYTDAFGYIIVRMYPILVPMRKISMSGH